MCDKEGDLKEDFIEVSGLKRMPYKHLWHPNEDFLKTLEISGIQAYILEGTIYGCFINKMPNSKIETQWFGHHVCGNKNNEGKIVPNSTTDLYQILEVCKPEVLEGVLFNLDLLSDR
jgi:hypothetical protein